MSLFGNLFDLDGDGVLSPDEKAAELGFWATMLEEESPIDAED